MKTCSNSSSGYVLSLQCVGNDFYSWHTGRVSPVQPRHTNGPKNIQSTGRRWNGLNFEHITLTADGDCDGFFSFRHYKISPDCVLIHVCSSNVASFVKTWNCFKPIWTWCLFPSVVTHLLCIADAPTLLRSVPMCIRNLRRQIHTREETPLTVVVEFKALFLAKVPGRRQGELQSCFL